MRLRKLLGVAGVLLFSAAVLIRQPMANAELKATPASADPKTGQAKGSIGVKDDTETVYTTFHVIPGKEAEFVKVLETAWPTYHKLGMVLETPHLILSGADEQSRPYFIEILTWKDHDTPDHASAEVQAIWDQMTALCERRDGHRKIEFYEVKVFDPSH